MKKVVVQGTGNITQTISLDLIRKIPTKRINEFGHFYPLSCSNGESSPPQALEVSESESLKGGKYYLSSALADGVLQQVEVTYSSCFK